jgi:predicted DNA-binding transcriptional regulator
VDNPLAFIAKLCQQRIANGGETNYHIFINTVLGITDIIHMAKLKPEDVRIVCSLSGKSETLNKSKIPDGFTISSTSDPVKTINFYTSTCFEGQDIYDENGRAFIVSERYKNHTKMDIRTTMIQIFGRIRNSKYKNEVIQIYSTSKYSDVSIDEFKKTIEKEVEDAEKDVAMLNNLSEKRRKI